mmetsp:Transcript_7125/g.8192  ORF Transcript_7125/g.8192 Transcript_7125/m.8192 type:complete len:167 (+) Transcript_7125:678-1178(+)
MFFPHSYIENIIIAGINKRVEVRSRVTFGEFLIWLGIWLLLSTIAGYSKGKFWSDNKFDQKEGEPYRFNDLMSGRRFDGILANMVYTDHSAPIFCDRFWEARQIIQEWNDWMSKNFIPSWINCLDKSMSIWHSRWTCPGWVFYPIKPHPYGNEYYTMCCCMSGILY